jgi:hypothetical protein
MDLRRRPQGDGGLPSLLEQLPAPLSMAVDRMGPFTLLWAHLECDTASDANFPQRCRTLPGVSLRANPNELPRLKNGACELKTPAVCRSDCVCLQPATCRTGQIDIDLEVTTHREPCDSQKARTRLTL